MNREELVKEIAKSTKLSQKSVSEVLSATVESIQNTVKKGDKVTLVGFGTFESRRRAARNGRNPQTGEELVIPACVAPAFKPGKALKDSINN